MSADVAHLRKALVAPGPSGAAATATRRFEWCVRISVYAVMALELLTLLLVVVASSGPLGASSAAIGLLVVASTLHVVADIVLLSWALDSLKIQHPARRLPRLRLLAVGVSTVASLICLYLVFGAGATAAGVYVVTLAWAALAPALDYRRAGIGVVVIAAVLSVVLLSTMSGSVSTRLGSLLSLILVAFGLTASVWLSGWMLRVHWQLHLARLDSARLAIADERLRISRDLHDVFGRTLATVSVKSQLAAELARRGRSEEAAVEIGQVSRIADDAGQEIRRVLRGYREADLEVELRGARSLLAAAGVDCTVEMASHPLGPDVTSTLAWVTREAVTNIIRHARATRAAISLTGVDPLVLVIENDGASPPPESTAEPTTGQGLLGMAERVAAASGVLEHGQQAGRFAVRVELPTGAGG